VLEAQTARFLKLTNQWSQMIEDFNEALKETGDIENWSHAIERDMREIAGALDYVHRRS
jgi:biogenesis of lysosome-related organelles complex 1 subunit 1